MSTIIYQGHHTFLQLISTIPINEEDLLVTIDFSSLYTNIIYEEGLQAMQDWMLQNDIKPQENRIHKDIRKSSTKAQLL